MNTLSVFAVAVALAVDAFAVCIGTGCTVQRLTVGHFVRMAGTFGFFQFAMPLIGCLLGHSVRVYIEAWDHWIAFALLAWVGISMIKGSFEHKNDNNTHCPDVSRGKMLFVLAVATSLDAMAVGLSFAMLNVPPFVPSLIIGIVCAALSAVGLYIGSSLTRARMLAQRAECIGGLVLIGIGIKIMVEHHAFG